MDLLFDGLCFSRLEGENFLFAIVENGQITLVLAGDGCLSQFAFVPCERYAIVATGL